MIFRLYFPTAIYKVHGCLESIAEIFLIKVFARKYIFRDKLLSNSQKIISRRFENMELLSFDFFCCGSSGTSLRALVIFVSLFKTRFCENEILCKRDFVKTRFCDTLVNYYGWYTHLYITIAFSY